MKNKVFKIVTAILIILAMTMYDFAFLGMNIVSYALENSSNSTNHTNVKFSTFFKTNEGNKITTKSYPIDEANMKLYMEVSVQEQGYFDGIIALANSNFNLKNRVLSDSISKIENNVITLNRITAGNTVEIEVEIEPKTSEQYDLSLLSMESKLELSGIYKDSTEKDINIKSEKGVILNLTAPDDLSASLSSKVITNRLYKIGDESKRLIQIEITSSVTDNSFPVKSSEFTIEAIPNVESVQVLSKGTYATNGKAENLFAEADYTYNAQNNTLSFTIENTASEGKISWKKSGVDTIIVTFILDDETSLPDKEFIVNSNVTFYGSEATKLQNSNTYSLREADGIVRSTVTNTETYMYKGKIYSKEQREYTTTTNIEANYANLAYNIKINQNTEYETASEERKASNTEYRTTTISKAELEKVLGANGSITIKDQNGNIVTEITTNTNADENGNIVINYSEGVKALNIETSSTVNVGIIRLTHTKVIKAESYSKAEIQSFTYLVEKVVTSYSSQKSNGENMAEYTYERKMGLNETKTQVDLVVEPRTLSTVTTNEQVKIAMTLRTDDESYDLFKNPTLTIKLPNSVKSISNVTITPLYVLDNFKLNDYTYSQDTRELSLVLRGEQTQYRASNNQGYIEIMADIDLEETTPNGQDSITLTYTNENAINYENGGRREVSVQISGIIGLIAYNNITSENIKTNSALTEGETLAELPVNSQAKSLNLQMILINNSSSTKSNVVVKGILPLRGTTELGENTISATLTSGVTVSNGNAKVYYTSNSNADTNLSKQENGWNEDLSAVENPILYMITIPEMASREKIEATYTITVPEGLVYNQTAKTKYTVNFTDNQGEKRVQSAIVGITTGAGASLNTTIQAVVGTDKLENNSVVRAGEVIRYIITVTNNGNAEAHNVIVKGLVPEGTVYVEPVENFVYVSPVSTYYGENADKREVEVTFNNIAVGESKTVEYEVRVKSDVKSGTATNKATVTYNDTLEASSNEISNKLEAGSIRVTVKRRTDLQTAIIDGQVIRYYAIVENISNSNVQNVELNLNIPKELEIIQLKDLETDNILETLSNVKIDSIAVGEAKVYEVFTQAKQIQETEEVLDITAIAKHNGITYRSNSYKDPAYGYDVQFAMTATRVEEYLKPGDTINFTLTIKNNSIITLSGYSTDITIPDQLLIKEIEINGQSQAVISENYFIDQLGGLEAGQTKNIKITAIVRNSLDREEIERISTVAKLIYLGNTVITTEPIIHYLEAIQSSEPDIPDLPEDPNKPQIDPDNPPVDPNDPNNPDNPDNPPVNPDNPSKNKYSISGRAWVDQNKNGYLDDPDEALKNITVKLLNIQTNQFVRNSDQNKDLEIITDEGGYYIFENIEEGNYIVLFEYDNTLYKPTSYKKYGIEESKNSNVAEKTLTINGEEKEYGATDEITLNQNISNINLGLVFVKQFDIDIDKYVSKVIVQTSKETKTYDYKDATFARVEINAKRIVGATILVQYTIKATNTGGVDAYINTLVDYAPKGLRFSSELNTDWYETDGNLYTNSLARTPIAPGESKEITLTLTKTKTDGTAELINNMAETQESYNIYGISDINSTEANKNLDENDLGSADLLVGIQTGSAFNYIALVISMLAVIGVGVYLINKKVLHINFKL